MAFRGRTGLPCGEAVKRSQGRAAVEGVFPATRGSSSPGNAPTASLSEASPTDGL